MAYARGVDFDPAELKRLGRRRIAAVKTLDEVDAPLKAQIRAARAAGVPQSDVAAWTGYGREQIRLICDPGKARAGRKARTIDATG